jgi:hypothetical protein
MLGMLDVSERFVCVWQPDSSELRVYWHVQSRPLRSTD